jgi:hypothetical protein
MRNARNLAAHPDRATCNGVTLRMLLYNATVSFDLLEGGATGQLTYDLA